MQCRYFIMALILAVVVPASGREARASGRFHYGCEWGIQTGIVNSLDCRFISYEGYLVNYQTTDYGVHVNGMVTAFAGYDVLRRVNLSVHTGYLGLADGERGVPVTLRLTTYLSASPGEKGSSVFAEGGISITRDVPVSRLYRLGYSFRARLADFLALDLNAGLQISYSHPIIYDKYSGHVISFDEIAHLKNFNGGLFITAALVF